MGSLNRFAGVLAAVAIAAVAMLVGTPAAGSWGPALLARESSTTHAEVGLRGMATGDISDISGAADGVTWTFKSESLDASGISGFEVGTAASLSANGATIPLTFVSAEPAAGAASLSDSFTGTLNDDVNGRTPDTVQPGSATWVESGASTGDLGIGASNWGQIITNGTLADKNLTIDTGLTDCVITANIRCGSKGSRYYYVYMRYVDANNWVRLRIAVGASAQILQENTSGSISTLATSVSPITTANAVTDSWVVTVSGTSISVVANGVSTIFSGVTFSAHTSDTHQGWGTQGDGQASQLESLEVSSGAAALITCTAAAPALASETVTFNADDALLDDGTNTSNVASGAATTHSSTQPAETDLAVTTIAVTDTDEITLTVTQATNYWGTPTITDASIKVWAVAGYGHPTVTSGNSINGKTITITLTASRNLYTNEIIDLELLDGWLVDARGNDAAAAWRLRGVDPSVNGSSPPATTTVVSNGRTSLTLGTAAAVSFYLDGVPAVVVPTTNTITAETPTRTTYSASAVHGAWLNPAAWNTQPFDARAAGYDAGDLPTLSVTVGADDSYVKVYSVDDGDHEAIDGASASHPSPILSYGVYHFVAAAPGATEIAPQIWGYDGATTRPVLEIDLDAIYAALPSKELDGIGGTKPDLTDVMDRVCQSNIGRLAGESTFSRENVPAYFTNAEGYGYDQSVTMGQLLIQLMGNDATEAEKRYMAVWLAHHGSQLYWSMEARGSRIPENGGLEQGYLAAVVAALNWTGNTSELAGLPDVLGMNELRQMFYWTQADIDRYNNTHTNGDADGYPVDDSTYSYMRREHTIATGGVSGNVITLDTLHQQYFEYDFDNGDLHLNNGTQDTEITVHERFDESFTVADATGFSAGQTVTLEGYATLPAIGTPDWGLNAASDPTRTWYMGSATYRSLNVWSMQVMFLEFLGYHTDFGNDAWRDECRAVNADVDYAGAYAPNTKRHESTYAGLFWDAYEADALEAVVTSEVSDTVRSPRGRAKRISRRMGRVKAGRARV